MPKLQVEVKAPIFVLNDFNGKKVHLDSFRNKKNVLLVFNRGFMAQRFLESLLRIQDLPCSWRAGFHHLFSVVAKGEIGVNKGAAPLFSRARFFKLFLFPLLLIPHIQGKSSLGRLVGGNNRVHHDHDRYALAEGLQKPT